VAPFVHSPSDVPYLPRWITRLDTLVRSAGVGAVATLADLLTLALLTHGLGVAARAASAPALCVGVAIQFVGNKRFAFRDDDPAWASQALRFAAVEALGFAANLALFDLASRRVALPPVALRLVTTHLVYFGVCLPLWSRIFRGPARAPEGSAPR
jgi:putative flippase GtrA